MDTNIRRIAVKLKAVGENKLADRLEKTVAYPLMLENDKGEKVNVKQAFNTLAEIGKALIKKENFQIDLKFVKRFNMEHYTFSHPVFRNRKNNDLVLPLLGPTKEHTLIVAFDESDKNEMFLVEVHKEGSTRKKFKRFQYPTIQHVLTFYNQSIKQLTV